MKILFLLFASFTLSLSLQYNGIEWSKIVPMQAPKVAKTVLNTRAVVYSGALFGRNDCGGTCGEAVDSFPLLTQARLLVVPLAINVALTSVIPSHVHLAEAFAVVGVPAMGIIHVAEVGLVVVVLTVNAAMGVVVHRTIRVTFST